MHDFFSRKIPFKIEFIACVKKMKQDQLDLNLKLYFKAPISLSEKETQTVCDLTTFVHFFASEHQSSAK
jgi:hypothetical protein